VLALASLPLLLGVVAASGIAPNTTTHSVSLKHVTQDIRLNVAAAQPSPEQEVYWREERIVRGDTAGSVLARLQVSDPLAMEYLLRTPKLLARLVPGRTIRAVTTGSGELLALRYLTQDGTELFVQRDEDGFVTSHEPITTESEVVMASGHIESSLFAATDRVGLSDAVAGQLAEIFSSEIDFHRDLQPGDHFSVVYEAHLFDGDYVRTGRILAAEFVNDGRQLRAVYFQDPRGRGGYYAPDGTNLRKAFLRSPLEFSRITSGFTGARLHPVLKVWRAHKGVDYGAPVGTRVRATADGYVESVSRDAGYGKRVVLRHGGGRSTLYAHLSGFADGLRSGQRVAQGDVIGYVGMTGLATGPHLHYEFLIDGKHHNPLQVVTPAGPSITREMRSAFHAATRPHIERLELVREVNLATVD
jgi:murein DD-endopeptidase MepM/ murein hydrolase activator NlpD